MTAGDGNTDMVNTFDQSMGELTTSSDSLVAHTHTENRLVSVSSCALLRFGFSRRPEIGVGATAGPHLEHLEPSFSGALSPPPVVVC